MIAWLEAVAVALLPQSWCDEMAQHQSVFIIALGRSGSSQLLNLLNNIPGYRIGGETDNAWLFLSRLARSIDPFVVEHTRRRQEGGNLPVCEMWPPFFDRAAARAATYSRRCSRKPRSQYESIDRVSLCKQARKEGSLARRCHAKKRRVIAQKCGNRNFAVDCPIACHKCVPAQAHHAPFNGPELLCQAREAMLSLHNPSPRARVFGFKEIYSDWVRQGDVDEILDGGVGFLRGLFPKAKFLFHTRENVSGIAASGWWRTEATCSNASRACGLAHFRRVARRYEAYVRRNPDHAFLTTLEGITSHKRQTIVEGQLQASQLDQLFSFLGENLTNGLRSTARESLWLRDWAQQTHTRRIPVTLPNGTVVYEYRTYAFSGKNASGGTLHQGRY